MSFEELLRAKRLKITPQRIAILNRIRDQGHMGIEEIYKQIKRSHPSISLATIYKNINALCEANILREIKAPNAKQKYELSSDRHLHMYCEACGNLEDIRLDTTLLEQDSAVRSGYEVTDITAVIIGICPECKTTQSASA